MKLMHEKQRSFEIVCINCSNTNYIPIILQNTNYSNTIVIKMNNTLE